MRRVLCGCVVVGLAFLVAPATATAVGAPCSASNTHVTMATIAGNLVVPNDVVCFVSSSSIAKNVTVNPGAVLFLIDSFVGGNVSSNGGAILPGGCGTHIAGSLVATNLPANSGSSTTSIGCFPRVDKQFLVSGNAGGYTFNGYSVGGTVSVTINSGSVELSNISSSSSICVVNNRGQVTLNNNHAGTFLQCQNNSPAPVGSGNSAGIAKLGQCASL